MNVQKVKKLQVMIQQVDFLNKATKQVFLDKVPYLNEKKFEDLYEIFEHDLRERNKLKQKKIEAFKKYKATVMGIYHKAKQVIISLKEKTFEKMEKTELKNLDQELNNL
jgi:hypothetical protein